MPATIARLYLDDPGFEAVRELARRDAVACCVHGQAEVIAAIHRKHHEGVFTANQHRQVLEQFDLDCGQNAFRWLPLSLAVTARVTSVYAALPPAFCRRRASSGLRRRESVPRNSLQPPAPAGRRRLLRPPRRQHHRSRPSMNKANFDLYLEE
jgi:hypothetical protein